MVYLAENVICKTHMSGDSFDFDFKPDVIVDGILGTGISGKIQRIPTASAIQLHQSNKVLQICCRCAIWIRSTNWGNCKYLYKM